MKFALAFLTALSCCILSAQNLSNTGKINGTILDASDKTPVEYASLAVFASGNINPVNGTTTGANGTFTIDNLPYGEYSIKVSFLGFKDMASGPITISKEKPVAVFPVILLSPVATLLQGVEISATAATVKNKIDKLVYNPENDLAAQGGTAIDVLKKVPMVTVDIDGNIELRGSPGINFLINGKPSTIFGSSLADALQSIPASQIKNIEVITNPGAKYDSQGTGGIINIILKDSKVEGVNGSVNGSIGTRVQNGSVNLNVRKGAVGLNAFFSGNNQVNTTSINSTRLQNSAGADVLNQYGTTGLKRGGYQSGVSIDWKISPKDNVTAAFRYSSINSHTDGTTAQAQTAYDDSGVPLYTNSSRISHDNFLQNSALYSLAYKKTFDKENQELTIYGQTSADHSDLDYTQLQHYSAPVTPAAGTASKSPGRIRETVVDVNYAQPVNDNLVLETGIKGFFRTMQNTVDFSRYDPAASAYVPDAFQSYSFNYNRNIYAYYASASFKLYNYIDVKAGGRYEYTKTMADFPDTRIPAYSTFTPSITASHTIDDSQAIKLSYSKRIDRPEYADVNPFVNMADPYNIFSGNPNLRTEIGNNIEAGYNKSFTQGSSLNFSAYYLHNSHDVKRYTEFFPTYQEGDIVYQNVSFSQRANIGGETKVGLNAYTNIVVTPQLTLRSNMMVNTKLLTYHYNGVNQNISGVEYRLNLNAAYEFANNLSAEIFVNYNTPRIGLQGKTPAYLYYTTAVRKQFLNKKLSMGFTATNPFNKYTNQSGSIHQAGNNQYSLRQVPFRSFGITLSFKFGSLKFDHEKAKDDTGVPEGF